MINAVIDISHHNRISSFSKVAQAGIRGVIQKATQGFSFKDPTFASNRKRVSDAGMRFGAYHFGTAGDPTAQADFFLASVGDTPLLVLDFEPNPQGHDMSLLEAEQFVHHVFAQTGRYPGLYSGHTVKEALAAAGIASSEQTELSKSWLWFARYGATPLIPRVWSHFTMWQYTDGAAGEGPHEVPGIGRCDRDFFNGTEDDLQAFWDGDA
ncbi:glycoside hydrolase family 25 protein [Polaromonas sp.]|uniref:glycoside hydrolase family 25 protein n=1 Tax=Polaromonas sp. TaxID=1869339 RepID=UPI0013BBEAB0|nr:glycoside hydrolase family 25 protein [Polaromonas sp.]NDP63054.1 glycoside hydrolase [Polaromonas sp.]